MHARALDQFGKLQFILQRDALRPAHRGRVLHRTVDHHRHEQQDNEVEEQRGDDLVDAEPRAQQRGNEQQQRAGEHRRQQHRRKQEQRMRGESRASVQAADGHRRRERPA
jgi:hypothetical protein